MSNRNYLGVTALYSVMGIIAGTLGSLMVLVQRSTGASLSYIGFIVSLFSLGSLLGIWLFNLSSSKISAGKIVPIGFAILKVGYLIAIHSEILTLSIVGSFLLGIGFGVLDLGLAQIVTRSPNRSAVKTNISNAIFGLGGVVGALEVAAFGIDSLKVLAYLILIVGIGASYLLRDNLWQGQKSSKSRVDFSPAGIVIPILAATGIYVAIELSAASWLPSLMESKNGTGEDGAGATALFYALFTTGRFIGAYFSKRYSAERLIISSLLLTLFPVFFSIFADGISFYLIALTGLTLGPIFANTMALLAAATPDNHGASALLLYASTSGSLFLFPVIGFAVDLGDLRLFPAILLALLTLSIFFYKIAFTAKRKQDNVIH